MPHRALIVLVTACMFTVYKRAAPKPMPHLALALEQGQLVEDELATWR